MVNNNAQKFAVKVGLTCDPTRPAIIIVIIKSLLYRFLSLTTTGGGAEQ